MASLKTTFTTHDGSTIMITEPTKEVLKKIDRVEETLHKVAINYVEINIAPEVIKRMKELIWEGGSNMQGMAWAYWTKRKGQKDWRLIYPSSRFRNFTWSTRNKTVLNYPILPTSYRRYRKNRTKIKQGQYAMFDSGRLITSFRVLGKFSQTNESILNLGSTRENILNQHEFGTSHIPRRPIMKPVFLWFDNNTKLKENMMINIMKETVKQVKGF